MRAQELAVTQVMVVLQLAQRCIDQLGYAPTYQVTTTKLIHIDSILIFSLLDNVYIADEYNHRIRKVTASTGMISTVAGNGANGYSGDNGDATNANINYPMGVAVDYLGKIPNYSFIQMRSLIYTYIHR